MKNWKFLFMTMTMVGLLFLAACGNEDEDTSNTGNMNEEEMSDDMEKEEKGDMSNEEQMEDKNEMKEKGDTERKDTMEDGIESEETTKDGM